MANIEKNIDKEEDLEIQNQSPIHKAKEKVKKLSWWAKLFLFCFFGFIFSLLSILITINFPPVKSWLANKAINILNEQYKTKFETKGVEINFLGDVVIHGVTAKDHHDFKFLKAEKLIGHSDWFELAFNSRDLKFQKLSLEELDLQVITYKGEEQDNFTLFIEKFDSPKDPNKPPFKFTSRIEIKNSKLSIVNENQGEDGKWLKAEKLNAYVSNLKVVGADVNMKFNRLSFITERWGKKHHLETLSGDLFISKEKFAFSDLIMHTGYSLLQGDLIFNLDKNTGWKDFNDKVAWDMNLKRGSYLHGYDMSYFVKNWDNYQKYSLSGKMEGILNNFSLKKFNVQVNNNHIQTKAIKFENLMSGNFHLKSNQILAEISYAGLRASLPNFIAKKMGGFADGFGKIKYTGFIDVDKKKVIAKGDLVTGIGAAQIRDFALSEYSSAYPRYKGAVILKSFDTKAITKQKELGEISGEVQVEGRGFDLNTLSLRTQSHLSSIEILGKKLHNLDIDGSLTAKQFDGIFKVADASFNGVIDGKIDFSKPRLSTDLRGDIQHLDLKYWGISDKQSIFKGSVSGNLSMKNVNDLDLDVQLNKVSLFGERNITIPVGAIKLARESDNRTININIPEVIKGNIVGKFNLDDVGKIFEEVQNKILVGNKIKRYYKGQSFELDFDIHQSLINYFEPNILIPDGVKIVGDFKGGNNDFIFDIKVPTLKYIMEKKEEISEADRLLAKANPQYIIREGVKRDSVQVSNIFLKMDTENTKEYWMSHIERVEYQGSLLKGVKVNAEHKGDRLNIVTNLQVGTLEKEKNNQMVDYVADVDQHINEVGDYVFKFDPTEVKISKFMWKVDTSPELNHSIIYRRKNQDIAINNLRIYSGDSEVLLNGVFKNLKDFDVDAMVKNMDVSKVWAIAFQDSKVGMEGIADGNIKLKMNAKQLEPHVDLMVNDIRVNNTSIGNLVINTENSSEKNIYDVNVRIIENSNVFNHEKLILKGTIDNNTQSPTLDLKANLKQFDLAFVQAFVGDIFSNFRGLATGDVDVNGTLRDINYGGDIAVKDFGLKLNFSGVDYTFDDSIVNLNNGNLFFNFVGVKDSRTNSKGMISFGQINLSNLSNIGAELLIRADDLMILNTSQKDFDVFWGKIYAKGDLFVGFSNNTLGIKATADVLQNSVFTLNSNSTSSVDEFKMLRFLEIDKEGQLSLAEKKKTGVYLNIDLDITADKNSQVNVLVGDEVGDISVRGNTENMRFVMDKTGNMRMFGEYSVESGTYVSKAILEKVFQIRRGSNLQWNGDVMNPELNITATYNALISNASEYLEMGSLPAINVQLQTHITNKLTSPEIKPVIVAQDVSSQIREVMAYKLATEEEKVLQFASILALGNFNVANTNASSAFGSGVNVFFKQLSSAFNSLSDMFQIDIAYVSGNASTNTANKAVTNVDIKFSPRWKLKTGVGVPIANTENAQNNYLSGEGIVEYDWSKNIDGSRIFRIYSKPSNVGVVVGANAGANQTYGGGVVLSYGFNRIFPRKKLKKRELQKNNKDSLRVDSVKEN